MREEGTSRVHRLLRGIRAVQDDRSMVLPTLNRTFDDWQKTTATRFGHVTHANLPNSAIEAELEAPKRHVEALEGSLRPAGH